MFKEKSTEKGSGERASGKDQALSLRWRVSGNSLQPRSGSRVIESWQNMLVYLPPANCCQTIYTVSHSARRECLMHLQSIYEDFCFEDSFLGNRVQTCMDELSFISAGASCKNETARISIFFLLSTASSSKGRMGGGPWKMVCARPTQQKAGHLCNWLRSPGPRLPVPALREKTQQQPQAQGRLFTMVCRAPGLGVSTVLLCLFQLPS